MKIEVCNGSREIYGSSLFVDKALLALIENRDLIMDLIEKEFALSVKSRHGFAVYLDWVTGEGQHMWQVDVCVDGTRFEIGLGKRDSPTAKWVDSLLRPLFVALGAPESGDHLAQYLYCRESGSSQALDWARLVEDESAPGQTAPAPVLVTASGEDLEEFDLPW
jgi:hypothetical protein